jgi:undecaprenyl-diphosphatase
MPLGSPDVDNVSKNPNPLGESTSRIARLQEFDDRLLRRLVAARRKPLTFILRVLCRFFDPDVLFAGLTVVHFSPGLVNRMANRVVLAVSASAIIAGLVKQVVRRTRPAYALQAIPSHDRFSFPSGHAFAAFATAIAMFGVLPWAVPPLILVAMLVAYARLYLGVHYPLDVLAGMALGVLVGSLLALI